MHLLGLTAYSCTLTANPPVRREKTLQTLTDLSPTTYDIYQKISHLGTVLAIVHAGIDIAMKNGSRT
jgi:hypothetical protein